MKVFIKTYGCQMNMRDSEAMAGMLAAENYEIVNHESKADIILFNTCSVREQAEKKAVGKLGFMSKIKKNRPDTIIGVMGCMAQNKKEQLLESIPHLDFVLGTGQLHKLPEVLGPLRKKRERLSFTEQSSDVLTGMGVHYTDSNTVNPYSAFIAVTRGCNRFCSYCIVPYVRGREISRTIEDVMKEARELAENGVREIMLLGQNVAAFGLNGDIRPPAEGVSPFADLLYEMNEIKGLERIRFTSPYVSYFNDKLIRAMAECHKVCHNVHLPLQSGSDRILKLMNRQYTAEMYYEKVLAMREAVPDITFSTDVIVGFPGETDEDFEMTRSLFAKVGYTNGFIFKYSPRKGTKAAEMTEQIPQAVKEQRNQILLALLTEQTNRAISELTDTVQEVLVEGPARNAGQLCGRTSTSWVVNFTPQPGTKAGDLVKVRIIRPANVTLIGEELVHA